VAIPFDALLARAMDELGRIVFADQPLAQILARITDIVGRSVPGASAVSITLIDDGIPKTAASTGEVARELDERQYAAGHGPCLDAARYAHEMPILDMATESRWPDYTPRAIELGVLSSLAIPLPLREAVIGAMNLYAAQPHAFDADAERVARTFASYAAITIYNAQIFADNSVLAVQMQEALASRAVIEQAKGIVMGSRRCTPDEAFGVLRTLSQVSNTKLRVVVQALVDTAVDPRQPSF
jgi:GAF domain-containing protein